MSVARPVPSSRRRLAAVAVAATLAVAGLAGAGLAAADGAQARPASHVPLPAAVVAGSPAPAPARAPGQVPVRVPADLAFELDVVPVTVTPDPAPARPTRASRSATRATPSTATSGDVRDVAARTLADLPRSAGVTLLFDDPHLGDHLGAVFMGSPGYLLVSARRLAGDPDLTRDVVRHEIAHVYQARLAVTLGYPAVNARMVELFGPGGLERAADCVALAFGASWTYYTTDCAGPGQAAAVEALVAGRMP